MQTLKKIKQIKNKVAIVRLDWNVPIVDGFVGDGFRIEASLPTINALTEKGAKVIVLAHAGEDGKQTLLPMVNHIKTLIPNTVITLEKSTNFDDIVQNVVIMNEGDIMVIENIRRWKGEKENDKQLASDFASLGDFYVNDAFSVSHRAHMSVVGIPKILPSYAGLQMEKEILNLSSALKPKKPFLFMLGGAKFETKMPLLKKYVSVADMVFVGGALANNFLKAKGYEVGKSVIDKNTPPLSGVLKNKKVLTPIDVIVNRTDSRGKNSWAVNVAEVQKGDTIVDVGPLTVKLLATLMQKTKLVVWNGPMGWYEKGHTKSTIDLLNELAKQTKRKQNTVSIIGGVDTVDVINQTGMENKFTFVSTGGGATLEFLAKGTLVGIKALK
ncbi:MAG: phosphoglycerate kinase [Minisyncoccia bacterium]